MLSLKTMARSAAGALVGIAVSTSAHAIELTVTHWGALMYGVPFAVAQEKGFFQEEGVEVEGFITSKGGGTTLRNALAAQVPYGEASLAAVVAAAQEGVPLTIVHSGVQSVGDILWVTRKDADIDSIEDLKGRNVSYTSPKSVSEMVLMMSLDAAGISPTEVQTAALGGVSAGLTALREGGTDAATILEPIWSRYKDEFKPVFQAADLLPPVTQTVGVVRTDYLQQNPDIVRGIIEARRRGVEYTYENPEEAAEILAKAYEMDPEIAREAVMNVVELRYWSPGGFDFDAMDNMVQGLKLVGAMEEGAQVDWNALVDQSFLSEDLRTQ